MTEHSFCVSVLVNHFEVDMRFYRTICGVVSLAALMAGWNVSAFAESGKGWFVPKNARGNQQHAQQKTLPPFPSQDPQDAVPSGPPVLPMPNVPVAPDIAHENAPPAAIIGVLTMSGVMRQSVAAMQIEKIMGPRRDALAQDVQREQIAIRSEQQKLQSSAGTMPSDQLQNAERNLQLRFLKDQRSFRERGRVIQEDVQVALNQIERELIQIIQKVAAAHGMNLVLHGEQIALHVDGQDITDEVAVILNRVLPNVYIPDGNIDPEELAKTGKMPTTADLQKQSYLFDPKNISTTIDGLGLA